MNKDDLISKVSSDVSLSKVDAAKIVNSVFNSIANALKRGDNVNRYQCFSQWKRF